MPRERHAEGAKVRLRCSTAKRRCVELRRLRGFGQKNAARGRRPCLLPRVACARNKPCRSPSRAASLGFCELYSLPNRKRHPSAPQVGPPQRSRTLDENHFQPGRSPIWTSGSALRAPAKLPLPGDHAQRLEVRPVGIAHVTGKLREGLQRSMTGIVAGHPCAPRVVHIFMLDRFPLGENEHRVDAKQCIGVAFWDQPLGHASADRPRHLIDVAHANSPVGRGRRRRSR
jgi:hypothetical protein